jgi:NAD(P)-dependent dehydrogenase (short-subunit alcohol dehydrogenase family)
VSESELEPGTRRVVVTGGGTGIGRAVAEKLLRRGGSVVVIGRRPEPLEDLARGWKGRAFTLSVDLARARMRIGLLAKARELLGGLDGFVHSAGAVIHQLAGSIPERALRSQLEINLVAPLRLGEEALEVLDPGGGMVFISSTLAQRPVPTSLVYSAAKSGLQGVSRALAVAGAPRGIRSSAVVPGVVDTQMVRAVRPGGKDSVDAQLESLRRLHPLGRLGTPEDVADAVVHLLAAPWTTGAELLVDGGLLLHE